MLDPDERARLTDAQDRLIELLVQQDEAVRVADWPRARELQTRIGVARQQADEIRH